MFVTDGGQAATTTATTNTTPQGTPPPQSTSTGSGIPNAVPAATKPTTDWTSGYSDELKGYIQAKGFKDPNAIAESYRNLEKTVGAGLDKIIKLPEKADAPEWNDIYYKLGKPQEAKNYKIPIPEGMTEDKTVTDFMRNAFFEANLTGDQAQKVTAKWNELNAVKMKEVNEAKSLANKTARSELEVEWGKAFDQNVDVAKKAAKAFGLDGDMVEKMESSLGFPKLMKFLKDIGSKIAVEGDFVQGNGTQGFGGAMEPAVAGAKIKELMNDREFIHRMSTGDSKAKAEWDRLHEYAFPGTRESVFNGPPRR